MSETRLSRVERVMQRVERGPPPPPPPPPPPAGTGVRCVNLARAAGVEFDHAEGVYSGDIERGAVTSIGAWRRDELPA